VANALVSEHHLEDGTIVLELRGELDVAVNDALRDVLLDTILTRRPPCVIVSMQHVTFVDSTGMGALLAGYNAARSAGVRYVVQNVAPFIEKQLRTTRIYDQLAS
jgi:anti-sigma B factor antagonist